MNWTYRNTVLVLATFAFFVTYFARVSISPVVPLITEDFAVPNTLIGTAFSGMWIAYGLMQYPSGVLADAFGSKRIILVSVGGTALMSVLAAVAPIFAIFALGMVGIGAVAGLHYTVASTLLSRSFDDIGTAIGWHSIGAPAAGLVAPIASAWVGVRYGWRLAVSLVVVVAIPVFVLFLWRVEPSEPRAPGPFTEGLFDMEFVSSFIARPTIRYSALVGIITMFAINGLLSFFPTFLVEFHAYSTTLAGAVFSVYFIIRGGTQIGVGTLSDRFDRDTVIAGCLLVGTAGLLVFLIDAALPIVLLGVVLFGTGTSFFAALEPKILDSLSEANRNAGFGVFRTVYVVGGSTGSIGVGFLADVVGWRDTFIVLAILFFTSLALVVVNRVLRLGY